MKKLLGWARKLWAKEPVLAGAVLPVAVTVGVLTQDQASAITNALTGAAAVAAELAAAFGVRRAVTSPATVVKQAAAPLPGFTVITDATGRPSATTGTVTATGMTIAPPSNV